MLGWIIVITAAVFMSRLAAMCDLSGWGWAVATFFTCLISASGFPWPFINLFIGLVISYGLLPAWKIARG